MMTRSAFEKNLALYGADLSRWPRADIKPALALVAASSAAAASFAAAERADHLLRFFSPADEAGKADLESLAARITRHARHVPQAALVPEPRILGRALRMGAILLLAAVMGSAFGVPGARSPAFAANSLAYLDSAALGDILPFVDEEEEDVR